MLRRRNSYTLLRYLASDELPEDGQLPSLGQLSQDLGISVAKLREQLEVARALGLVDVRPRTGIRRLPYAFAPAVRQSLAYALSLDAAHFEPYAELRNAIEAAFWKPAVASLHPEDHQYLVQLMNQAWEKLRGTPIRIPHLEHRELHLAIYRRLDNPFVTGILETYWDAYEAVGLNLFADYPYLEQVWQYHQNMVDAVLAGRIEDGYQALLEHKDLLYHRPHLTGVAPEVYQDHTRNGTDR